MLRASFTSFPQVKVSNHEAHCVWLPIDGVKDTNGHELGCRPRRPAGVAMLPKSDGRVLSSPLLLARLLCFRMTATFAQSDASLPAFPQQAT